MTDIQIINMSYTKITCFMSTDKTCHKRQINIKWKSFGKLFFLLAGSREFFLPCVCWRILFHKPNSCKYFGFSAKHLMSWTKFFSFGRLKFISQNEKSHLILPSPSHISIKIVENFLFLFFLSGYFCNRQLIQIYCT